MKNIFKILSTIIVLVIAVSSLATVTVFAQETVAGEANTIDLKFDTSNLGTSLTYMWQGMLCIFVVIGVIILSVYFIGFVSNKIEERKKLSNRLKRIEGQVRGIKEMLLDDKYCVDILTQTSAISSALNSFAREILESHIRSCVAEGVRSGDDEKIEELIKTIERFIK